ncbi:unnamed protein product [Paramecium sonneborni]|uniref:Uncharacterized protein n=1 Tax=Paramecium sonneborni TaxID=65129 RepID=A0A8S1QUI6_9CILI|nr:unnamed protein product [Paramecium sonneborni]
MNEQKLREIMKIYTVSKQVNKKAEKNFLKISSQFYKMHKADMTPEFLNEINSLRQQIKEEKQNISKQTSPIITPRLTESTQSIHTNQAVVSDLVNKNKQKLDSLILEGVHTQIFILYIDEIKDLKQQLNKANQQIENQKKQYDIRLETLNHQLQDQKIINDDLKKEIIKQNTQIQALKQILLNKVHNRQNTEISNPQNQNLEQNYSFNNSISNSFITQEKSLDFFKYEIEQALQNYRREKQKTQGKETKMQK